MTQATAQIDWHAKIRALAELIEQEGPASEAQGEITQPLADALVDSGLFAMQVPEELGGGGTGLLDMLETTVELVYHNASVGWNVLAINVATATVAALLEDDQVARELFATDPYPRMMGYGAPVGRATPVDGGYKLTGRFQFGSGIAQSTWVQVAGPDPDAEPRQGPPVARWFVVPIEQVRRLGNWDVYGLEATTSEDFEIVDAFVPRELTFVGGDDAVVKRGQAYRRVGLLPVSLLGNIGVTIGIARRALDEVRPLSLRKARPGRPRIADQQMFRYEYAQHDIAVHAVHTLARELASSAEQLAAEQRAATPVELQRFSQACIYSHRVASEAVRFAYEWAGTSALRRQGRLGHLLLDMAAATQHQANDRNLMVDAGGVLLESS